MQNNSQISFYYFFNLAKDQIQKQISEIENCFWINDVFHHTGYDNLCFVYKNNAFSVLIDITDENGTSYLPEDKKNQQILAAEKYNLIPCIFTIVVPDIKNFNNVEQIKPKTNGWNLVNTETKEQINPTDYIADEKKEFSEYEQRLLAINYTLHYLSSQKCEIVKIQSAIEDNPQIFFKDQYGELSWVIVRNKKLEEQQYNISEEVQNISNEYPKNDGYYAEVLIKSIRENVAELNRTDNLSLKLFKFDRVYTTHTNFSEEDMQTLLIKAINTFPIDFSENLAVYSVPYYDELLFKISAKYINDTKLISKDFVAIPIKYDDNIRENKNLGLYLYHIDDKNSHYAKRGYVNPEEVIIAQNVHIAVIRRVSGVTVSEKYVSSVISFEGAFEKDIKRQQFVMFREILLKYGKASAKKLFDILQKGINTIEQNQLAKNSPLYKFTDGKQYYEIYKEFVDDYLKTLNIIADFPQKAYDKAINDILQPKNFMFDFYHTKNTFIDIKKQEFNFIDFYFDSVNIEKLKQYNALEFFRNVLVGTNYFSRTQPMDYIVYPDEIAQYEKYQKIITDKINKASPEKYRIEYLKRDIL